MPLHITTYHVVVTRELQIAHGGMETHLIVRESETFYSMITITSLWESKMRIDMNVDQYEALTDLICFAYDNGYYHNRLDTDTFDEMADAVIGAKR